jgi:hypothetical protein
VLLPACHCWLPSISVIMIFLLGRLGDGMAAAMAAWFSMLC